MQVNLSTSNFNRIFFLKLATFIMALVLLDVILGKSLEHLYFSQTTGKYHRLHVAMDSTRAQMVFFGSSRAVHHYDPGTFHSSLGITTYNAGAKGEDIIYTYGVLKAVLARYTPDYVILNLDELMFNPRGKWHRLSELAPFYRGHPELHALFDQKGKLEFLKLQSYLFTYNSTLLHLINYAAFPQVDFDGFLPIKQKPRDYATHPQDNAIHADGIETPVIADAVPIDPDYLQIYRSFLQDTVTSGAKPLIVVSPGVRNRPQNGTVLRAQQEAMKQGIPVWDYSQDDRFLGHFEYFDDSIHMNEVGARLFSSIVAGRIGSREHPELLDISREVPTHSHGS